MTLLSDYDRFAWAYNRHWSQFSERVAPIVMDNSILKGLPAGAHILDLCCGTGQLARALVERGYRVTGLDISEEMIRIARENAPGARFVVDDARSFAALDVYDAVVCVFDSLNHIMTLDELMSVFRHVCAALREGGVFFFDMNTEEGYRAQWKGSSSIVEDDYVSVARSSYSPEERTARFDATLFRLDGVWRRSDVTLYQRCYSEEEISTALREAGLADVRAYAVGEGLRLVEPAADTRRLFFVCYRPAGTKG